MNEADAKQIANLVLAELIPRLVDIARNVQAVDVGVGSALDRIGTLESDVKNELAKLNVALFEHMEKSEPRHAAIEARVLELEQWRERVAHNGRRKTP